MSDSAKSLQAKAEAKPVEDSDILLCRKIATEAGVPSKEAECVTALKSFGEHADFDKATSEIAKIVGKTPQEVMSIASKALQPQTPAKTE